MKRNRLAVVGIVLLVLAVGGWFLLRGRDKGKDKATAAAAAGGGGKGARSGAGGQAAVDVRAAKRGGLAGRVRDGGGAGIAGALVCATFSDDDDELTAAETREPRCAISAADGAYAIGDLFAASYGVSASAPHFRPVSWRGAAPDRKWTLEIQAGTTQTADLVMLAGGVELKGRVRDVSGGGIAEALVSASGGWRRRASGTAIGRSDTEGNFTLWVDPGEVNVTADADGYAPGSAEGIAPGTFIEVLLTPESVLVGRVVEAGTETPIAGARVAAQGSNEGWGDWRAAHGSALTGVDGRFRIDRLAPGRYKPEAETDGRYGQARESVLLGLGQTSDEIVIEAHAALRVSGRVVVTPGDAPCTDGTVELRRKRRDFGDNAGIAKDGTFLFKGVMPGSYTLDVGCRDKVPEEEYPPVEVKDADVADLELAVHEGRAIRGTVLLPDGKPAEGVSVWAQLAGGSRRGFDAGAAGDTDQDGKFELKGLGPGKYRLDLNPVDGVAPDDETMVDLAADHDTERVVIKLTGGGTIAGTVVDEDNLPQGGVTVVADGSKRWRWGGNGMMTTTADDGTFTMKDVSVGEVRVVAERNWSEELRTPGKSDDDVQGERVTIRAGETRTVRLVVERQSGEIHGKVTDAAGAALGDAFVSAQREDERAGAAAGSAARMSRWGWGGSAKPVVTDLDGAFTISKLSPGKYTLRAFRKGGGEGIVEHVAVGTPATVVIATTGSIVGTVVIPGASPPERYTISILDREVAFRRNEDFFRAGGAWAMRDLPPGTYQVTASADEGQATSEILLAVGQNKLGVVLELQPRATLRGQVVDLETNAPIPGMRMVASGVKGGGRSNWRGTDNKMITDGEGRYEIEDAPTGKVSVRAMPMDFRGTTYGFGSTVVDAPPGEVTDVPPIRLAKRRVGVDESPGDLGFELKEFAPTVDPDQLKLEVALVRPDGPAAKSGLQVGDVFVSIDGHDVTGANRPIFWQLAPVREGTTVTFGLARGVTVQITAAKPL